MVIVWPAVHCSFHCIAAHQNTIRLWLWEGNLNEAWVSWQASRLRSVTTTLAFSLARTWCVSQCQSNLTYYREVQNRHFNTKPAKKSEWQTWQTARPMPLPPPVTSASLPVNTMAGYLAGRAPKKKSSTDPQKSLLPKKGSTHCLE